MKRPSRMTLVLLAEAVFGLAVVTGLAIVFFRARAGRPAAATAGPLPTPRISFVTVTPRDVPPTPTPDFIAYTVQAGDTLWDIAIRYRSPIELIVNANPGLNPNLLAPGQVVMVPALDEGAQISGPQVAAEVVPQAGEVNLQRGPGTLYETVAVLSPGTPLGIVGRTEDGEWIEVLLTTADQGWLPLRYVDVPVPVGGLPVTWRTVAYATPAPGATTAVDDRPLPVNTYRYVSGITFNVRRIYLDGQRLGNRPNVFSKIGDSITASEAFLRPLGLGRYDLRGYADLQPAIDFFAQAPARDGNSFANRSLAAETGWTSWSVLNPRAADARYCLDGEMPLVCEYRLVKPAYAVIMLGTNDVVAVPAEAYEHQMRQVIEISQRAGVIPIVSTIPPMLWRGTEGRVEEFNAVIRRLAAEYEVPLVDYWSALQDVPNYGLASDGLHPGWVAGAEADFLPQHLKLYGMTVRNLIVLQAVEAVWRAVGP